MREISLILFASFIAISVGVANANYQKEPRISSSSMPDEVFRIFQNSCFDCHTKGGKRMAMAKVNFSEWDNYSQDKKVNKSKDIVKMLSKGAMPPKVYRQQHPEKIPTPEQIDMIKKWNASLSLK